MLRAKVCVARCVTLRAMLRMLWHMMLRVRLRVADFDSSVRDVVSLLEIYRRIVGMFELCVDGLFISMVLRTLQT